MFNTLGILLHVLSVASRPIPILFAALLMIGGDAKPYLSAPWQGPASQIGRFPTEDDHVSGRAVSNVSANLPDEELIIGVESGIRHRAYPIRRFWSGCHVVNDLIGGQPVTVTYCGLTRCTRVFAGKGRSELDVRSAGYLGGLLISTRGQCYRQTTLTPDSADSTTPFPYATLEFEISTWGAWRAEHPDTDVAAP
jgi:Protein of unknown function (DUF3179)